MASFAVTGSSAGAAASAARKQASQAPCAMSGGIARSSCQKVLLSDIESDPIHHMINFVAAHMPCTHL